MLVLWLIVVLGAISAAIVMDVREATALSGNARARAVGRYAAESGVVAVTAEIESRLATIADSIQRRSYLNGLDSRVSPRSDVTLGDAAFAVALVDVSARLDVNNTDEDGLTRLLSMFGSAADAAETAAAIRAYIDRQPVTGVLPGQSISGASGLMPVRSLRSLDEIGEIPGVDLELLRAAAPYLTVDGDGNVNRATASDTVLAAAGGSVQDEPSRLLVVSRGWMRGHTLTHEIQAVYAIAGNRLTLVRWRERDL
jgi:type II secretory pathway component PulK